MVEQRERALTRAVIVAWDDVPLLVTSLGLQWKTYQWQKSHNIRCQQPGRSSFRVSSSGCGGLRGTRLRKEAISAKQ